MTNKNYEVLAKKIEDVISEEDVQFGDIVAALALVNLWVTNNYILMCMEDKE